MSTWMTLAPAAKALMRPVTRSSNLAPSEISRSQRWIAVTAEYMPCMPGMPRCWSWESGKDPLAISVVTTGILVRSAKASNSAEACDLSVPPPT